MAKVVQLNASTRGYIASEQVMDDIRMRLYQYDKREVADACQLSIGTIYSIQSGRTKWPRPNTLFAILRFLQIEFRLYDTKTHRYLR
jgi:transcriptional regulator with XRE-family HTH domain